MSHVTEKLAEFIFGELPAAELTEARLHIAECADCREQVSRFQRTLAMLNAAPDVEPPRNIVFEFEKPRGTAWIWRWLAPMAASAAVALGIVWLAPHPQPQIIESIVQQPLTRQPAAPPAQPIDYRKMIEELRAADRAWVLNELAKRDGAQAQQMERVRGELALLSTLERRTWKETIENASSIQLLAQK